MIEALDWLAGRYYRREEHAAVSGVPINPVSYAPAGACRLDAGDPQAQTYILCWSFHDSAIAHVDHAIGLCADLVRMRHQDDCLTSRSVHLTQQVHDLL